jgi:hypothetical protein
VRHSDTDHEHIHVAINKIHPETLRIHSPAGFSKTFVRRPPLWAFCIPNGVQGLYNCKITIILLFEGGSVWLIGGLDRYCSQRRALVHSAAVPKPALIRAEAAAKGVLGAPEGQAATQAAGA